VYSDHAVTTRSHSRPSRRTV